MPHMTFNYMFEMKSSGVGGRVLELFFPERYRSFLLELTLEGEVTALSFGDVSSKLDELKATDRPYIFYDPLEDGVEYVWMQWHRVSRETMERLCGFVFEQTDFRSMGHARGRTLPSEGQFPESWSVMF